MAGNERALVHWLAARARIGPGVELGIGDDAAVLDLEGRGKVVFCSDQTVEGVHFLREEGLWFAGRKALARCVSDCAAMAARPLAALLSVAIPESLDRGSVEQLLQGVLDTAEAEEMTLAGGDLATSPGGLYLDVSVLGVLEGRTAWRRSGARVGDDLVVTGPLGGSREGHHLRFVPRWREALVLAESGKVRAAMDLSDGLGADLPRLLEASGCGAVVERELVPRRVLADGRAVSFERAWNDGEDFELLLAMEAGAWQDESWSTRLPVPLVRIGRVVGDGLTLLDVEGHVTEIPGGGYEHRVGSNGPHREP